MEITHLLFDDEVVTIQYYSLLVAMKWFKNGNFSFSILFNCLDDFSCFLCHEETNSALVDSIHELLFQFSF